jgi:SAM-dependent methyltransferase
LTETICQEPIVISAEPEIVHEAKSKQKNIMILDVGSGPADGKHIYLNHADAVHVDVQKNSFHLEVQCDAQFLPFYDDCFDYANLSHILEHVDSPFQVMREISRVSRIAIVKVPNASYYRLYACSPDHIYGWTTFNLENLIKRHFDEVKVYGSYRIGSSQKGIKKKLSTLKTYILAFLFGKNELTAIGKNMPN